jgi:hypothetical protein
MSPHFIETMIKIMPETILGLLIITYNKSWGKKKSIKSWNFKWVCVTIKA